MQRSQCFQRFLFPVMLATILAGAQVQPGGPGSTPYLKLSAPRRILADAQAWEGDQFPHTLSVLELRRGGFRYWGWYGLNEGLSMKCGAGPGEMLSLSLKDVGLDPPHISIPRRGAKRISRERYLELNGTAAWALERLIRRAIDECKCTLPEHYLIPRRNPNHTYDPTRAAQDYRAGLRELLAIAEVKVRRYDFRHHAVSVALSNPNVPLEAARAYFGWMSPKMVQRYYHVNQAAMRVVPAALEGKPPEPTKQPKSRRKATVVEIVRRPAIAAVRRTRLCLPPAPEEEQ